MAAVRPSASPVRAEDSGFAGLGLHEFTRPGGLDDVGLGSPAAAAAEGSLVREPASPSAMQRIYSAFSIARSLLGVLMLIALVLLNVSVPGHGSWPVAAACVAYALACLAALRGPQRLGGIVSASGMLRHRWFVATVGVDLAAFGVLMVLVGPSLNVAALFALPVLMSASLMPRRIALGVAAVATLVMLGGAALQAADLDLAMPFMQAGLAGAGLFIMAVLTSELAARLAREERAARSTLALARQQAMLNRLVIEEMQDGVLVVDRAAQVRAANPSALALIGLDGLPRRRVFDLHEAPAWAPLVVAIERGYAAGAWPDGGRDITLRFDVAPAGGGTGPEVAPERTLRLRMRFARRREREMGEALCVLFLEDVRTLRARAQQEKLAAMGRVSAGIAHEIRNPLAAIAQANALLAEDLREAAHRQLATIVTDNVARLGRIVDDVLAAAPGGADHAERLDLVAHTAAICDEWQQANRVPVGPGGALVLRLEPGPLRAAFDPDHLRRIVVNLLDNAWRHGTQGPGAIRVSVGREGGDAAVIAVASDGSPIPPDVERHLFEPFFSTRSRGSGLGLYICRELCARHGATIDYRPMPLPARHGNVFLVNVPLLPGGETRPGALHDQPDAHRPVPSPTRF